MRGFRRAGSQCNPIELPAHAALDYSGHGWDCERGYRRSNDRCLAVDVPAHASLDFAGHNWMCDRGYIRRTDQCIALHVATDAKSGRQRSRIRLRPTREIVRAHTTLTARVGLAVDEAHIPGLVDIHRCAIRRMCPTKKLRA